MFVSVCDGWLTGLGVMIFYSTTPSFKMLTIIKPSARNHPRNERETGQVFLRRNTLLGGS